ncbi:Protein RTM1 [Neolecta irregularis DAH-3]|uniref:Protein RTM1 n=1 Tax=Neolecta irregularis (strain DAH-3) TaxID=1198029 RepID=A0A1U7LU76_NEOID|nr:Protein RTM1 [Neolecta irregularis DAH-3]|eukprot:OLL26217.1 Protein RTM1 [Neolecta irregularis DAH-3]
MSTTGSNSIDLNTVLQQFSNTANYVSLFHFNYYYYIPSLPAAIIFFLGFTFVLAALIIQSVRHKVSYLYIIILGILGETVGYLSRILGSGNPYSYSGWVSQYALVVLCPIAFAAGNYVIFGRLLRMIGKQYSFFPAEKVTIAFVASDIICFLIQVIGAVMLLKKNARLRKPGRDILLSGLVLNVISFIFFLLLVTVFERRTRKLPSRQNWIMLVWTLYFSMSLILLRGIFRVAEYSIGFTGYLAVHEVFWYVFDALPMIFATVVWSIIPPYRYLERIDQKQDLPSSRPTNNGEIETKT